jgi:hypothetical protein
MQGNTMIKLFKLSILIFTVACPTSAFAYLDPGTGSILLQGLIAGLAAIAVSGRLFWARIKGIFSKDSSKDSSVDDQ